MRTLTCLSLMLCASIACSDPDPATDTTVDASPEVSMEVIDEARVEVTPDAIDEARVEVIPDVAEETHAEVKPESDVEDETDGDTTEPFGYLAVRATLSAEALADACYDVRFQAVGGAVTFSAGDAAHATRTGADEDPDDDDRVSDAIARGALCASRFGVEPGAGEVTYFSECTPGVSYDVTLWVHNIYLDEDADYGDAQWSNPCGGGDTAIGAEPAAWQGGCTHRVKCAEGFTQLVVYDLSTAQDPNTDLGFVDFGGVTCSAKLDTCQDGNAAGTQGGDFIELLFGDDGNRVETAVLGFACWGSEPFSLYVSDVTITCEEDGSAEAGWQPSLRKVVIDATTPAGVHLRANDVLFDAMIIREVESIGQDTKLYQNYAIAVRSDAPSSVPGATPGNRNCRLTAMARAATTLTETPLGFESTDRLGYIDWSVRLTDDSGALDCRSVPLGSIDPRGLDYDLLHFFGDTSFCTEVSVDGFDVAARRSTVGPCQ